ncbi:MAG: tetratricopeptide repeat protein [Pyrinomonadaceae bacterium]
MKLPKLLFLTLASITLAGNTAVILTAQTSTEVPTTAKLSESLARTVAERVPGVEVSRERREQAFAKLLEAQGYIWRSHPSRAMASVPPFAQSAKSALLKAIEADPNLAEAYTALAELALTTPPNDVDDAIGLASIATKLAPNNFGGHQILARLFTYKSSLNSGTLDPMYSAKAVAEWKEITRLDPRNAEAWAFMSEFYGRTGKPQEQIAALRKWVSSSSPLDVQFYRGVMGSSEDLSSESASLKLGSALLYSGNATEAVSVLSLLVSENPENAAAVDLLREGLSASDPTSAEIAVEALKQAIYAKPENTSLIDLLAGIYRRSGKYDTAVKLLKDSSLKLSEQNHSAASSFQMTLGDVYSDQDQYDFAVAAFERALELRNITEPAKLPDNDREFASIIFERLIRSHNNANSDAGVHSTIARARALFGPDDLFADRQLIGYYRGTGEKPKALAAVRLLRGRFPNDYGFLRIEAGILTDSGRVDEAIGLLQTAIRSRMGEIGAAKRGTDDSFVEYLYISQLYNQADRGKDAAVAAKQAFAFANGSERKQIAKLTLAAAQQTSGELKAAEDTIKDILKQSPRNPIALNNLGYFLLERNERIEEALTLIQKAITIDPTNPSFLDSLGWAYFKLGNLEAAEKSLRSAARINSGSATIFDHLGDVYDRQGRFESARAAWKKALALASNSDDVIRLRLKLKQK